MTAGKEDQVFSNTSAAGETPLALEQPAGGDFPAEEILTSVGEAIYEWNTASDVILWSENVVRVLGITDIGPVSTGRGYAALLDQENMTSRYDTVMSGASVDDGSGVPFAIQYRIFPDTAGRGGSSGLWLEDTGRWFAGEDGRPERVHGIIRVINIRHEEEERLAYLSRYDKLTGQLNQSRLVELLEQGITDCRKYRTSCGFLVIAIDKLDIVNSHYGFEIGDRVITAVSQRLKDNMRKGDVLGRYSGNKLGVILYNCSEDEMPMAADRFLNAVNDEVISVDDVNVGLTVTIGGVIAPRYARGGLEAISHALEALEVARGTRRGTFLAYRSDHDRDLKRRKNIEIANEIVTAWREDRIELAFQPIVSAADHNPVYHEALLRMRRPDGELISSGAFIELAEKLGLVRILDCRALELAVKALTDNENLRLSVNVSAKTITDREWLNILSKAGMGHPGLCKRLTIEITETAMLESIEDTKVFAGYVKDLGCRIAIDDFGAGYTSYRTLRELDVDVVKIDGSFISNLLNSPDDQTFVSYFVNLSKSLGIVTVAEWVGDMETASRLKDMGVLQFQGEAFGLSKPKPIEAA